MPIVINCFFNVGQTFVVMSLGEFSFFNCVVVGQ